MLYILLTTFFLFTVLYWISENALLDNFRRMEKTNLRESMKQNLLAYYDEYTNLGAIAINYAGWDDTYKFVDRPDIPSYFDPYLTVNYSDSLFTSSRLNAVILMNNEKKVYFAKAYDYAHNRLSPYPDSLIEALLNEHRSFLEQPDVRARKQGLLIVNQEAWIAASYPILTSNNEGPVHGTLVFARRLDDHYTEYISNKNDMPVDFQLVSPSFSVPSDATVVRLSGNKGALFWFQSDNTTNTGYCLLRDVNNQPAMILTFKKPRELYTEAQKSIAFFLLYMALTGIIFLVIIHYLLQKTLFQRLQNTVDGMNIIKRKQDFSIRLFEYGNDEITKLEKSFNRMMVSLQEAQFEIQFQAEHDPLTGLANRKMFHRGLEKSIAQTRLGYEKFAVLFIDLDRFKVINDTMGHRTGDMLLIDVGSRLRQCIREGDFPCRMGGDEFCIITVPMADVAEAEQLAQQITRSLGEPFELGGQSYSISASIGISLYPDHGTDAESLLHYSDTAMLDVKETGKNSFRWFTKSLEAARSRRLRIEQDIQTAIANDEFSLQYQPKWDLTANRMTGVEALLRWNHSVLGAVSPAEFIPICETHGWINEIGEWIFRKACRQFNEWQSRCPNIAMTMAINVSGVQLLKPDFVERIREIFQEEEADPHGFELEVTESFAIERFDIVMDIFLRLRELGFTISIDDFGAGYSSMKYLCQLPIQCMKLDKTLVDHLKDNPRSRVIVSSLIEMAHQLNMTVIAEGIETMEQMQLLMTYRCDQIQGYYISRPMDAGMIPAFYMNKEQLSTDS